MRVRVAATGEITTAHEYSGGGNLVYSAPLKAEQGPGWWQIGRSAPGRELPSDPVLCFPLLDPEGKPQMKTFSVDEEAADLIAAARDAKVFICTFAFLRTHWERLRSEEHTSELQSLMRISYAVFCLKKKKHQK